MYNSQLGSLVVIDTTTLISMNSTSDDQDEKRIQMNHCIIDLFVVYMYSLFN